ncbi:MAG TPA: hypothetical protein VLL76_03230 [Candidatus Omnitrophota bacterium]|nr:hypothetical protein [Candidatus Omnitrophota bacterium]
MRICHVCGQSWLDHSQDCRVRSDLERMRRVLDRLREEGREQELQFRMGRYLDLFGNLSCQGKAEMPTHEDCNRCGHKDICVILPPAAQPTR